jgi:hypothetical protein
VTQAMIQAACEQVHSPVLQAVRKFWL